MADKKKDKDTAKQEKEAAKLEKLEKKKAVAAEKAAAKAAAKAAKDAAKAEKLAAKKSGKSASVPPDNGTNSDMSSEKSDSKKNSVHSTVSSEAAIPNDTVATDSTPQVEATEKQPQPETAAQPQPDTPPGEPERDPQPTQADNSGGDAPSSPEPEAPKELEQPPAEVAKEAVPAITVNDSTSPEKPADSSPSAATPAPNSTQVVDVSKPMKLSTPSSSNISRTGSARRSLHGAPVPLGTGVTIVAGAVEKDDARNGEEDESCLGQEVVEEVEDEKVGSMTSENAQQTAQYLTELFQALKITMAEFFEGGTNAGYSRAYQGMGYVGRDQSAEASQAEGNKLKNRYGNILAYDRTRVHLNVVNGDPDTDYINANWISGYKKERCYIASQGPVPNSFISHWRMVWQEKIETIVMVTHEVENNRMKCHRYWPDPTSRPPVKTLQYGDIYVTHLSSIPHKHYILRTFEVSCNGETRTIRQFAYTSWPDHGVPLTTHELLGFRNAVNSSITNPDVPQLIHCSAGVGRTGTYIAIDRIMKQCLDMGGSIDVDAVVTDMRECRNFMVQTEIQYMFIYRAVLDAISELLSGESTKAQQISDMEGVREAAKLAKQEEEERAAAENAEIEKARMELLARESNSAAGAAKVVALSIKDRVKLLQSAEERWLASYKQSLDEWNDRNQFEAETYDLTSTLTPIQSRLEALRQKGLHLD